MIRFSLDEIKKSKASSELNFINRGIERESLRVNSSGKISQTPHPSGLGSALTNPYITTDFSEALLELVTPTFNSASECLKFLTPDKLAGHFHDTFQNALNNIKISLEYGIKTFDSSVGGLGGCPYSPGAKGNISTEKVNNLLLSMGYKTNLNIAKIKECNKIALNLKEHGSYE